MQFIPPRFFFAAVITTLILAGCSMPIRIPIATPAPTPGAGAYVATIEALQTRAVATAGAQGFGPTSTATPPAGITVPQTGGVQSPVVVNNATCWRGPGSDYVVISTIQSGTAVSLLGRGVIAGWIVVRNPANGDPCWLQASNLQIPSGVDVSALPIYNPPWTPTITPLPASVTPTSTP